MGIIKCKFDAEFDSVENVQKINQKSYRPKTLAQ